MLGAAGTIGPAIARDLAESEEVDSLLLLDRDGERLEAIAAAHDLGAPGCELLALDAAAGALAGALAGADVLVNAASYRVNLDAMSACLEAGCHYLDLGGLYWMTARQLELGGAFERAGLLALLGIGSAPGKTNLMAAQAAERLGGLESVAVSAAGRDLDPPAGLSFPYALRTLLDELTMAPVAVRGGEPVELEPLADGGEVDFGEPVGRAPTIHTLHSEMLTFPSSFGCREASFRLSLAADLLASLRGLASASEAEVERAAGDAARPSARTVSVHVVEAVAGGRSARARCVTRPHEGWGIGGGIVSTAAPSAAAVRLLARGAIEARGALPPERCLAPHELYAEVESRGAEFTLAPIEEVVA